MLLQEITRGRKSATGPSRAGTTRLNLRAHRQAQNCKEWRGRRDANSRWLPLTTPNQRLQFRLARESPSDIQCPKDAFEFLRSMVSASRRTKLGDPKTCLSRPSGFQ
jgi:hypothetical protein